MEVTLLPPDKVLLLTAAPAVAAVVLHLPITAAAEALRLPTIVVAAEAPHHRIPALLPVEAEVAAAPVAAAVEAVAVEAADNFKNRIIFSPLIDQDRSLAGIFFSNTLE